MSRRSAEKRKAAQPAVVEEEVASPEKRARVDVDAASAEGAPAQPSSITEPTTEVALPREDRLAGVMPDVGPEESEVLPVDVLLRGLDAKKLGQRRVYLAHKKFYTMIMENWERSGKYFSKEGLLTPAGCDMKLNDHRTDKTIPFKTSTLTRGGPVVRTPLFIKAITASITPEAARTRKERFSSGNNNNSSSFFLDLLRLEGNNYFAKQQAAFMEFLAEKAAAWAMLMTCKETETPIPGKAKVKQELLNNPQEGFTGEFKSLDDVPLDHPKVAKLCKEWLSTGRMMLMNKDLARGKEAIAFTFKKNADDWVNGVHWAPMNIVYWQVDPTDFSLRETKIEDEATIARMIDECPYGIDFRFRAVYDKKMSTISWGLQMEKIYFFPQLKFLTDQLMAALCGAQKMSDEDLELARAINASYREACGQSAPPQNALTHEPVIRCDTSALSA